MQQNNFMEFKSYKTWYTVHGKDHAGTPLFVLHGGPGYPHNGLNNIAVLADNDYPVVFYDQLGCGLSDRPSNPSLWTVDLFVEELETLRQHLGYDIINLLGQSWGGSLALEYCLKYPEHVQKLVLHSPLVDSKLWAQEADRLKDQLPDNKGARMRALEQAGDTDTEEYRALSTLFNDMFVLRLNPKPQDAIDSETGAGMEVYQTMWGPSEALVTGVLKDWSIVDQLKHIRQKTLLLSGAFDEATPRQMQVIADSIPDVHWELFEQSSHCANLEEPDAYMQAVSNFLGHKVMAYYKPQ